MHTMKTIVMGILCIATAGAFGKTIYLKVDATGDGSGDSWANACTDIATAVGKLETGSDERQIIYAAQGVYVVNATITAVKNFELYGGFKGDETGTEEEMLAARDWDEYQTIFTGDKGGDDMWVHIVPDKNDLSKPQYIPTDEPVIKDGKVNLPAYTGDYDAYVIKKPGAGAAANTVVSCFSVPVNRGDVIIDGLWIASFWNANGTVINGSGTNDNSSNLTIGNCRFVGHRAVRCLMYFNVTRKLFRVHDCKFLNNAIGDWGYSTLYGNTHFENCDFIGATSMGAANETGLGGTGMLGFYNWYRDSNYAKNCTFARLVAFGATTASDVFGSANAPFEYNTVTNCFISTSAAGGLPLLARTRGRVANSYFGNIFYAQVASGGKAYSLIRPNETGNNWDEFDIRNVTFEGCELKAVLGDQPGEGEYAIGIVGHAYNTKQSVEVNDSSFIRNKVSAESGGMVQGYASDCLVQCGITAGIKPELALGGCTVLSCGDAETYSVVQIGANLEAKLNIVNTIFMSDGDVPKLFRFVRPELVCLECCTGKNLVQPPAGVTANCWTYDEIPLQRFTVIAESVVSAALRPMALPPEVGCTANVRPYIKPTNGGGAIASVYQAYGESKTQYLLPYFATANFNIGTTYTEYQADIEGVVRPASGFTRGAIQTPDELALTGRTLTLRRDPLTGGAFTGPAVQAVAAGMAPQQVTVVPSAGRSFDGWYDENGDKVSDQTTLTIASLDDDQVLTARFAAPQVKLTFELGDYATYADGTHTYEVELQPGATFSAQDIPAYAANEGWHLLGWDKSLPQQVPDEATTWTITAVTTALRRIFVVPANEAKADADGTSWEKAYGSISAAYADAARYRGELWLKEGTYVMNAMVPARANVLVIGGFSGTESSSDKADPAAHPTVLTGDVQGDDMWAQRQEAVWVEGFFNAPTNTESIANIADNTDYAFYAVEGALTNILFKGVVFTGFRRSAVYLKSSEAGDVKVDKCRALAVNTSRQGYSFFFQDCGVSVSDSDVVSGGCGLKATVSSALASKMLGVRLLNCQFEHTVGYSTNEGAFSGGVTVGGGCWLAATNCLFRGNRAAGGYITTGYNAALTIESNGGVNGIYGCSFVGNSVTDNGKCVISVSAPTIFDRCRFEGNQANEDDSVAKGYDGTRAAGIGTSASWLLVKDSLFKDQVVYADAIPNAYGAYQTDVLMDFAAAVHASSGAATLLNCTIEGSVVRANEYVAPVIDRVRVGVLIASPSATLALVNTQVVGTKLEGAGTSQYHARPGTGTKTFINSIVTAPETTGLDELAWRTVAAAGSVSYAGIANSYLADLPDGFFVTDAGNAYSFDPVTEEPHYEAAKRVDPTTGFAMPVVKGPAPYLRGRGVYLKDNAVWFRDTVTNPEKPWRKAVDRNAFEADGSAAAPSRADGQVADAFGAPRRGRHCTLGPLVGPPIGLMLMVR